MLCTDFRRGGLCSRWRHEFRRGHQRRGSCKSESMRGCFAAKPPLPRVFRTQRQLPQHCLSCNHTRSRTWRHVSIVQPDWGARTDCIRVRWETFLRTFCSAVSTESEGNQRGGNSKRLRTLDLLLNLPYMVKEGLQQWHSGEKEWRRPPGGPGGGSKKNYSDDLSQRAGEEKQLKLGRRLRLHGAVG